MKLIIKSEKRRYEEEIDVTDIKEHFEECQGNGANPHLEKLSFKEYTKPVTDVLSNVHKYNGNHFIFGYLECLFQSDHCPRWIENEDTFEVFHLVKEHNEIKGGGK